MSAGRERGFSLVAAMAGIAIMLILMGAAVPSWRYVMKNMREEELIFRGGQIADAIDRYQRKHGGAPPTKLEDLVKGKFLRKAWADPMTPGGKWRFLRPGEVGPRRFQGSRGGGPAGRRRGLGGELGGEGPDTVGGRLGAGFVGVATTSDDESFRIFNGQTRYDEWFFVAGAKNVIGKPQGFPGIGLPPGAGTGSTPGMPPRGLGPKPEQTPPSPQIPQ
jgi:type II secretory pathway pseudopilin PulG